MMDTVIRKVKAEVGVDGEIILLTVFHNMPSAEAFEYEFRNWFKTTKKVTEKSLCTYVMSRHDNVTVMTEKQFKRLSKIGIFS